MPLHVPPLSRRAFLATGAAALTSLAVPRTLRGAQPKADPNRLALLSDTHIPSSPDITARDVNMTESLRYVVAELDGLEEKPAAVVINGDCAYLKGLPDDYANFARCVAPLREAGLPLHLTMGNHDDRGPLYDALADQEPENPPVESKHVSIIESPHANWFLLDSLMEVDVVTGELGDEQLSWLAKALDARADKPAILVAHHNPQFEPPPDDRPWGGIRDTAAFFDLIHARKHVKAFIYGHTHDWGISRRDRLHLINLPPVAYIFRAGMPRGWVQTQAREDGISLELRTIDPSHPKHGEKVDLAWS